MVSVCFYFQVHQPFRLRRYPVFDIGKDHSYYDDKKNKQIIEKVAKKCYIPANNLLLQLLHKHPDFKISYSFSGVVLDQFQKWAPEILDSFQDLVKTGKVELLDETYHHSLSFLYSKNEFKQQILLHNKKIKQLFNYSPKIFRNTELIYNNELAKFVEDLGYNAILAEGADHILGWRSPNFLYSPSGTKNMKLLLKNYKLSDDIAFRFSQQSWKEWPLTTGKFSQWVNKINGSGDLVNLFMDYETFGEHQWSSTGIFKFLNHLPEEILSHPDNNFMTPSEVIKRFSPVSDLDIPNTISWADMERDTSAWLGNDMQQSAIQKIYSFERAIKNLKNKKLLNDWRRLQTSDHFYYMCTKWFNDGDVHKYFNPYDSPYEAFITFMNIMNDFEFRLRGEQNG